MSVHIYRPCTKHAQKPCEECMQCTECTTQTIPQVLKRHYFATYFSPIRVHGIQKVVASIPISSTSQPLAKQGVVVFLDNAIEVGCGAGAIRELPAEEKRAIFPPMRMLDTQEPIGHPPDRVLPVQPRILSGAHGCLRPFPCRRASGCGGCHWYFHCVYACLCHDLRHCLWASPVKNPSSVWQLAAT
jgi:hypothetical protein